MPKIVDHDQRRAAIAMAYWRVVRRDGIEAATVRSVAAEAQMTPGAMRHYFADHAALRSAAMLALAERVAERVGSATADEGAPAPERARRTLLELVPLDDERQGEAEVWFAFVTASRFNAAFQPMSDASYDWIRALMERVVRSLRPSAPADDIELETERLFAFVDGLVLHAVQRPGAVSPERMVAAIDRHVSELERS